MTSSNTRAEVWDFASLYKASTNEFMRVYFKVGLPTIATGYGVDKTFFDLYGLGGTALLFNIYLDSATDWNKDSSVAVINGIARTTPACSYTSKTTSYRYDEDLDAPAVDAAVDAALAAGKNWVTVILEADGIKAVTPDTKISGLASSYIGITPGIDFKIGSGASVANFRGFDAGYYNFRPRLGMVVQPIDTNIRRGQSGTGGSFIF